MVVDNLILAPNRVKSRELFKHVGEIIYLYQNCNMTLREIGQKFNCDKSVIKKLLVRNSIPVHGPRTRCYTLKCMDCSSDFVTKALTAIRCKKCRDILNRNNAKARKRKLAGIAIEAMPYCVKCGIVIDSYINRKYCDKCRLVRAAENKHSAWHKNPDHYRMKSVEHQQNRRARKYGLNSSHLNRKFLSLLKNIFYCCVYCGSEKYLSIDHVVPLSRNGDNSMENLVLACKSCNSPKHNKYLLNFIWSRSNSIGAK